MAASIAALTAGGGGLQSTSDASGNLNLVSGTTTIVAMTSAGIAVTGTLSSTGITTVADGTAALPAIVSTTGTADTGLWFPAADTVAASTAGTERLRIDSNGNLMVGQSTPNAGRVTILTTGDGSISCAQTGGTGDQIYFRTSTNTLAGYITCPSATTTSYSSVSDYRLKENATPMTGALAKISALKPCNYKWISDGSDGQGFIAHEIQSVVPDCVVGEKDAVDAEGNPKYQGVDTSFLVATLTAAIQELKAIIDTQAAQITALNAKVGI